MPAPHGPHYARTAAALLLLWLFAGFGGAARADGAHHTLWTVKGRYNTVYLFGSIHVLKPGDSDLPAEALQADAAAKAVVMELDLGEVTPDKLLSGGLALETLPEGQTLSGALGADAYKILSDHARPLGVDLDFMSHFQPWFVAVTMTQLELVHLGYSGDSGVDEQIAHKAQADGKRIIGLETLDDQLGLFARMPLDEQRRFLLYSLADADETPAKLDDMVTAWRHGDTLKLESLLTEGLDKFPDLYRTLTTDRNRKWLPTVSGLLQEKQDYLVVVGAMHLIGKGGLVDLLTRAGFAPVQQ